MGLKLPGPVRFLKRIVSQDARIAGISVQRITVELSDPRQLPQRCGPAPILPGEQTALETMRHENESLSAAGLPCSEPVALARRRRDDSSKEHQRQR